MPQLLWPDTYATGQNAANQLIKVWSAANNDTQVTLRPSSTQLLTRQPIDQMLYRKQSKFFPLLPQCEPISQVVIHGALAQTYHFGDSASIDAPIRTTNEIASPWSSGKTGSVSINDIHETSKLGLADTINANNLWCILCTTPDNQHGSLQEPDHTQVSVHAHTSNVRDCLRIPELDSREVSYCHSDTLTEIIASEEIKQVNTLESDSHSWGDLVSAISAMPTTTTADCLNELLVDHDIIPYDKAYASFEAASIPLPPSPGPHQNDERKSQNIGNHKSDSVKTYAASTHVDVDSNTSDDLDASIFLLPSPVSAATAANDRLATGASSHDQDEEHSWLWSDDVIPEMEESMVLVVPCGSITPDMSDIDDVSSWTTIDSDETIILNTRSDCNQVLAQPVGDGLECRWYQMST